MRLEEGVRVQKLILLIGRKRFADLSGVKNLPPLLVLLHGGERNRQVASDYRTAVRCISTHVNQGCINTNGEEKSSFTFEDAMAFMEVEVAVA